ncbi:uncharacterized protein TrAtP1_002244 [Trichoderma atroviride]|uniref:uncharacterized protein n=1 Tax=Hypocrea atroviridis TaxID=63577 RepID=UPI0033180BAC|nr:hypothetical protein TrAtP1_002244 [Trichoderma atroviride]
MAAFRQVNQYINSSNSLVEASQPVSHPTGLPTSSSSPEALQAAHDWVPSEMERGVGVATKLKCSDSRYKPKESLTTWLLFFLFFLLCSPPPSITTITNQLHIPSPH